MQLSLPQTAIYTGLPDLPLFCRALDEYVSAIPGVNSVGAVGHLPLEVNACRGFQIEGRPPADPEHMPGASYSVACSGYFRSMGIPILSEREFTYRDTLDAPRVIVINQAMAREFWPKENPIGARGTDVLGFVLGSTVKWALAGLVFGIAGSIGIAHVLGTLLYGVRPTDPAVLGTVSMVLAGVGLVASCVPARRAVNLDPARTLRRE
jgi:hypothetical protein